MNLKYMKCSYLNPHVLKGHARVMAEDIQQKLEKYRTAPFDARFPNQNQTRKLLAELPGWVI